jgi:non-ribosomal peptide synthetase-like protein
VTAVTGNPAPVLDPAYPELPVLRPVVPAIAPPRALFPGAPAAAERTLLDVLDDTARRHPTAPALDDETTVLDYRTLLAEVDALRARLAAAGIGVGDRVGIRVPSGTVDLYLAILATLAVGAAYVPVDADDPEERAELVFGEAGVCAWLGADRELHLIGEPHGTPGRPGPGDDAWIIFTSGSTGKPKGVAVTHRSAAAFVDAEAGMFLQDEPIGPGDRVLAGLSVAFDASCEEMWLAWRHGACLVPSPRSLVRTGLDLGPWLVRREITIVSTVPTLAALWPIEALDEVRLLIFGGEACPPELAERLAVEGREVWNTYGPTEATVVACASPLTGEGPVRIGLPLAGWDLAVVDKAGQPVAMSEVGELVIGGVGLARYLDSAKDAEKYVPLPALGWQRAYFSGDLVRAEPEGLLFMGRGDEQIKLGGRRIELGEVDAALQALPNVAGAAAAVRTAKAGNQILVGYVVPATGAEFDAAAALATLREQLPAALVPLLATVDDLPTRTSGKVDRNALPWPLPLAGPELPSDELTGTAHWLAEQWSDILGSPVTRLDEDFFAIGGGSLAAAQLVSLIRERFPAIAVADLYTLPTLGELAAKLDELAVAETEQRVVVPTPKSAGLIQSLVMVLLYTLVGLRWLVALATVNDLLGLTGVVPWAPTVPWWAIAAGWVLLISPFGRMGLSALGARMLLRGLKPGSYPRGSGVHLRLWAAERMADLLGVGNLSSAPWITYYARALGAKIGPGVDLHSLPPVTGMLKLGKGAAVEPEVDLAGWWLDGDTVHVGKIRIGAGARIGSRSTLFPGARIGKRTEIGAGSGVVGAVPAGQHWAGSPAVKVGKASSPFDGRAPRSRRWVLIYGISSLVLGLVPMLGVLPGLVILGAFVAGTTSLSAAVPAALAGVPLATVTTLVAYAVLIGISVRLLGIGIKAGNFAVHSRIGWQVWATERLMDLARIVLFPMYASLFTPVWLRLLGARVGRRTEVSTVLALPKMTTVADGAFLADDTMVASYELGGGWLRVGPAKVGARAFLGNSGMTAGGRKVPAGGLVGVLSATPKKAKAGSSWLGMPPMQLRRTAEVIDSSRTFDPPKRLVLARALVELCRMIPVMCTAALAVLVLAGFDALIGAAGWWAAALAGGVVLFVAGLAAAAVTSIAKWTLVGRFTRVEHPLWSSFVWRNELADTFVETLAVPWFAGSVPGTPLLTGWLRTLGARIGAGVWCDTYWLPEADLVELGAGASVNRGCVLQTHLFHDRVMSMDGVTLGAGATLGPHGIVLPGARISDRATVGPASLVMRGESVPADTRWLGNPITVWGR